MKPRISILLTVIATSWLSLHVACRKNDASSSKPETQGKPHLEHDAPAATSRQRLANQRNASNKSASFPSPDDPTWLDPEKQQALLHELVLLSKHSPEKALHYLKRLPAQCRDRAAMEVAGNLMTTNPDLAWQAMLEISDATTRASIMHQLAMNYADENTNTAYAWAVNQHGLDGEVVLSAVLCVMASKEPTKAAAEMEKRIQHPGIRDRLTSEILQRWVQLDAKAAADYALKLPEQDSRINNIALVLPIWVNADESAATTWVQSIGDESTRQHAETRLANAIKMRPQN